MQRRLIPCWCLDFSSPIIPPAPWSLATSPWFGTEIHSLSTWGTSSRMAIDRILQWQLYLDQIDRFPPPNEYRDTSIADTLCPHWETFSLFGLLYMLQIIRPPTCWIALFWWSCQQHHTLHRSHHIVQSVLLGPTIQRIYLHTFLWEVANLCPDRK